MTPERLLVIKTMCSNEPALTRELSTALEEALHERDKLHIEMLRLSLAITTAIRADKTQAGGIIYAANRWPDVEVAGIIAFQQAQSLVEQHFAALVEPLVEVLERVRGGLAGIDPIVWQDYIGIIDAALAPYRKTEVTL